MSVTITLKSQTSGYADQTLSLSETSDSVNYDVLVGQLGISGDETVKAVVMNADGAAVQLVPRSVKSGESYSFAVLPKTDAEIDGTTTKWQQTNLDENATALKAKFDVMGSQLLNAAMNGYLGDIHNQPEHVVFPDYNAGLRSSFAAGIKSQIPQEFTTQSTESKHAGGNPYEPTIGDLANWRTELLRWAFVLGIEHEDKRSKDFLPTPVELREAYKLGKEAVCLGISPEDWGKVNKDTFKLCAVPVAYASYEGGKDKHLHELQSYRAVLRKLFVIGVEDAWTAREHSEVTAVTSRDRVPETPDLQFAFNKGVNTAKSVASAAPGCKAVVQDTFEVLVEGECEVSRKSTKTAFEQGMLETWEAYSGIASVKPDEKYYDTGAPLREAFKEGVALRHAEEKRKEEEAKAAEREAAEANEEVKPNFFVESYHEIKDVCCPIFTNDADNNLLCCGTSLGDWVIILVLFMFYYFYLAMWFWAHIEILMTVVEPNRPW